MVSSVSASAAVLSVCQRGMRGNRTAIPDLSRFVRFRPSKANSVDLENCPVVQRRDLLIVSQPGAEDGQAVFRRDVSAAADAGMVGKRMCPRPAPRGAMDRGESHPPDRTARPRSAGAAMSGSGSSYHLAGECFRLEISATAGTGAASHRSPSTHSWARTARFLALSP